MRGAPDPVSVRPVNRPRPADALLAAAAVVAGQLEVWLLEVWRGPRPVDALAALVAGGALAWLPSAPVAALLVALTAYSADTLAFGSPASITQFFGLFAGTLVVAARGGDRRWAVVPCLVAGLVLTNLRDPDPRSVGDWVFPFIFFGVAWLVGHTLRRRSRETEAAVARASRLEREREALAQAAVLDERVRIARELHDIVAHSISVIVVQAAGGRAALAREPARARAAFDAIEATGSQAMVEMRRLLGVLRTVGEASLLTPQPGLGQLEALAERAREAGLEVETAVTGVPPPLPAGLDLSAYRILQEAVTNAIKHAGRARVRIAVAHLPGRLDLSVEDDGAGGGGVRATGEGAGHGIVGMRERAELYGGTVEAGPAPGGGFRVSATIPTEAT